MHLSLCFFNNTVYECYHCEILSGCGLQQGNDQAIIGSDCFVTIFILGVKYLFGKEHQG